MPCRSRVDFNTKACRLYMQQPYQPPTQFSVFPPVVKNLLILNGLFFFAQFVVQTTGMLPLAHLLNSMAFYAPGAPEVGFTIFGTRAEIPGFRPWQLITYAFLHGGIGHLFFNMFALWMFGAQIENMWGSRRFGIYFFTCVVGAAVAQMFVMWGAGIPTLGASGGVYGVLLAFGMMFPNRKIMLLIPPIPIKAKWFVLGLGAFELYAAITGTQAGVANFAHLGGAIVGLVMIQYWRGKLPWKPKERMYW